MDCHESLSVEEVSAKITGMRFSGPGWIIKGFHGAVPFKSALISAQDQKYPVGWRNVYLFYLFISPITRQ
jgi:hypothetical protein